MDKINKEYSLDYENEFYAAYYLLNGKFVMHTDELFTDIAKAIQFAQDLAVAEGTSKLCKVLEYNDPDNGIRYDIKATVGLYDGGIVLQERKKEFERKARSLVHEF